MSTPVILELALNGATPRSRNRYVPRTPAEIAEVALEGVALGASIVHNHNDDPMFTADGVHAVGARRRRVLPGSAALRRRSPRPGRSWGSGDGRLIAASGADVARLRSSHRPGRSCGIRGREQLPHDQRG